MRSLFQTFWQVKFILVQSSLPLRKAEGFIGYLWQPMTARNLSVRAQAWKAKWTVFKIQGFVCKRFLPSFPSPSPLFYSLHFSRCNILCSRTPQKRLLRRLPSTCLATLLHCKLKHIVARIATFVANLSRSKIQCCKSAEFHRYNRLIVCK